MTEQGGDVMKINRTVDGYGRVFLSNDILEQANIKIRDLITVNVIDKKIIIEKDNKNDFCILCHSEKNLINYNSVKLCEQCIQKIKTI